MKSFRKLGKTRILEMQVKCILQVRKGINMYKKWPTWLTKKVMEAVKRKKDSFMWWNTSQVS